MKNDIPSWTPVRRGRIYCAPACGRGCSFKEFTDATERAAALAARMGAGWEPRVWENLGWHFDATAAGGRLGVCGGGGTIAGDGAIYTAFLNVTPGGCIFGAPSATTPEEAVREVISNALVKAREIVGLVLDLRGLGGVELLDIERRLMAPSRAVQETLKSDGPQ